MDTISLDRRDLFRGAAATAVAGGLVVTAGEDARAARPDKLRQGDTGWWVKNVQRRLLDAHFWLRQANGTFDDTTQQAVMALQKAHGLSRDGIVGPNTWSAIYKPRTPRPRTTSAFEIDKTRQLQIVARWGWAQWVFNTSTGNGERYWSSASGRYLYATTPSGTFRFNRAINGMRNAPLGELWRPRYFNGGIAIHGSPSIPGYPASHGCARLSNRAINYIWWKNLAPIGRVVKVY
ncbi:L,D-transpeptidase family protein [Janibacter indicus]|uniref:L,D-transpeptidase family protein n=1 Tax=Janibacter indicus TaxID=857417 RepID=UPI003EBB87AD